MRWLALVLLLASCDAGFAVGPTIVIVEYGAELPDRFAHRLQEYQCVTEEAFPVEWRAIFDVTIHVYPRGWPPYSLAYGWVADSGGLWARDKWSITIDGDDFDALAIKHEAWQHSLPWWMLGEENRDHDPEFIAVENELRIGSVGCRPGRTCKAGSLAAVCQ